MISFLLIFRISFCSDSDVFLIIWLSCSCFGAIILRYILLGNFVLKFLICEILVSRNWLQHHLQPKRTPLCPGTQTMATLFRVATLRKHKAVLERSSGSLNYQGSWEFFDLSNLFWCLPAGITLLRLFLLRIQLCKFVINLSLINCQID